LQTTAPYNLGAFRIRIDYPADYPFKPPKIKFETPIYHPNVDEKGQVCLSIIQPQNWKAATKTDDGSCRYYHSGPFRPIHTIKISVLN